MGLGRGAHTFTGDSLSVSQTGSIANIQMLTTCDVTHLAYFVTSFEKSSCLIYFILATFKDLICLKEIVKGSSNK